MVISLLDACLSTEIPFWMTSAGSRASACFTLFCISTAAKSGSVSMSKVMVTVNEPELVLRDSM